MRALVVYESMSGAPTHMHGLSTRSTRRMAAQAAAKDGSGLRMDPDAPRQPEDRKAR